MSAIIPFDPTWVSVVVKPTDGDSRNAANVNITFEALKWRTDFIYENFLHNTEVDPPQNSGTFIFSGFVQLAGATTIGFGSPSARTYPRVVTSNPSRNPDSWWAEAEQEPTIPRPAYKQKYSPLSPDAPWLVWRMRVPAGSTLKSVKVQIDPPSGHGGNLPDEQPKLSLWKCTASNGGLMTSITSVQDAQPDAATYEQAHDLSITGMSYSTWGPKDFLVIGVRGEEGNNAVAAAAYANGGLRVFHPRVEFSREILGEE